MHFQTGLNFKVAGERKNSELLAAQYLALRLGKQVRLVQTHSLFVSEMN